VVSYSVFEHLHEYKKALSEMARFYVRREWRGALGLSTSHASDR
jgi:hypothetical protein